MIAAELDLPLYTIQMDKVVTKFMGETSTKLRQIFDNISTSTGVYFLTNLMPSAPIEVWTMKLARQEES